MKIKNIYLTIALILIGFGLVTATPLIKQEREAVPAGGGSAQSSSFKNFSTVGEPVVGSHSSASFSGTTGFLFNGEVPQEAIVVNVGQPYSKTYGEAKFTVTYTGGSGTGAVSYSSDRAGVATIDAGTGEVTIVGAGTAILTVTKAAEPGKFAQQTGTATLTVGKAPLTVTTNAVATCKGTIPTFTAAFSGFVNGETETTLGTVGLAFTTNDCNTPGTYDIFPSGLSAAGYDNYAITYTKGTLTVDATTVKGDNPENVLAKVGDNKTFTTANGVGAIKWQVKAGAADWAYIDPAVTTATLTLSGITAAMNGNQYRAEFTSGACASVYTAAATLTVDDELPTLSPVAIASNNDNTTLAKVGNIITLTFTSSETISEPTVKIAGHTIDAANVTNSGNNWTATYAMLGTDTEGNVSFEISNFADLAGNAGVAVSATTAPVTLVTFDKTAPTAPTVVINGGEVINIANQATTTLSISGEVGTAYNVSYTTTGGVGTKTAFGTLNESPKSITVDLSGLEDGTVTASVTLTDAAGNVSAAGTDTETKTATEFTLNTMVVSASGKLELTFNRNVGTGGDVEANYSLNNFNVNYYVKEAVVASNMVTIALYHRGPDATIGTADDYLLNMNISSAFPQCSTLTVTVASVQDAAGNTIDAANDEKAITNTTVTAPIVNGITRLNPLSTATNLESVTFRVQFDKEVTYSANGTSTAVIPITAFKLIKTDSATATIASVTAVDADGSLTIDNEWDVVVNNIAKAGTIRLDLDQAAKIYAVACGGQPTALMASDYKYSAGQSYSVDRSNPVMLSSSFTISASAATKVRSGQVVKVTVNFSEAMESGTPVTIAQTVAPGIFTATNMIRVSSTQYVYDWTVGSGNYDPSFTIGGGADLFSNAFAGTTLPQTLTVDNTAPTVAMTNNIAGRLQVKSAEVVSVIATFSEAVTSPKITISGANQALQPMIQDGTNPLKYTFNWTVGEGNYNADVYISASDAAGNSVASTPQVRYIVDNTAPTVAIAATPDKSAYTGLGTPDKIKFTATFTEANTIATAPQISVAIGELSTPVAMTMVDGNNKVWEKELTIPADQTPTNPSVTITAFDVAGNAVGTHTGKTSINVVNVTPQITSIAWVSASAKISNVSALSATTTDVKNADTVQYYVTNNANADGDATGPWTSVATIALSQTIPSINASALEAGNIYIRARAKDATGRVSAVISSAAITKDVTAPVAGVFTPANNASGVATSGDLVINFSEPIAAGTGKVKIHYTSNSILAKEITITTGMITNTPAVGGNPAVYRATIPYSDLANNTKYYVAIASGVITDAVGNPYAGISANDTWSFTTIAPTPYLTSVSAVDANNNYVTVEFSEAVYSDAVSRTAADTLKAEDFTLAWATGKQGLLDELKVVSVTNQFGGTAVAGDTKYRVNIGFTGTPTGTEQIIVSMTNDKIYNSLGVAATYDVSIVDPSNRTKTLNDESEPTIASYLPVNNYAELTTDNNDNNTITITFNKIVQAGAGSVYVKKLSDNSIVHSVAASSLTYNAVNKTISFVLPNTVLSASTTYYITLDPGVVKSLANISFVGISSNSTYRISTPFSTPDAPTIAFSSRSKTSLTYTVNYGAAAGALVVMTGYGLTPSGDYVEGTPSAAPGNGDVSNIIANANAVVPGLSTTAPVQAYKVVQFDNATSKTVSVLVSNRQYYFRAWAYVNPSAPVYSAANVATDRFTYSTSRKASPDGWVEIPEFNGNFDISQVYPNPTTDVINFKVIADETQEFTYELVTMSGQSILTSKQVLTAGQHDVKLTLNNTQIASGTYTLIVRSGSDYLWQQVSIVK